LYKENAPDQSLFCLIEERLDKPYFCLKRGVKGGYVLKENHKYYEQIMVYGSIVRKNNCHIHTYANLQCQIAMAHVPYGELVIAFNGEMVVIKIPADDEKWKHMKKGLKTFYTEKFLPTIFENDTKRIVVEDLEFD
jgi:hypothetical protein